MNKIVCDVCGTSYPDTALQCPICGTAKTDANKATGGAEAGYAYVKGGRFSKANVRKRNAGQKELPRVVAPVKQKKEAPAPKPEKKPAAPKKTVEKKQEQGSNVSNLILVIIAALLVVAIIVVCVMIVREHIGDKKNPNTSNQTSSTQTTTTVKGTVPCTELTLALNSHTFTMAGDSFMISVKKFPADTTDSVRFESSDEEIATVDDKGIITAVADGTATIYVYCGDQMATFTVVCNVGVTPGGDTKPTEPTPTDPPGPAVVLELNRSEFTLDGYGAYHNLYDGLLDPTSIVWTSSDEQIATVTNGKVVAVGNGDAVITAEYMGMTATCIVHCKNVVVTDYSVAPDYGFGPDYTVKVGDTIVLYLVENATGRRVQAEYLSFTVSREGIISISTEGKIQALASGTVTVTITYADLSFKAIVRVTG